MFVMANLLSALSKVIDLVLVFFWWLILIRAIISWVNPDPLNPIVQFLERITEPVLSPIRRMLPTGLRFGLDISPIIAFLLITFLRSFLVSTLVGIAQRL